MPPELIDAIAPLVGMFLFGSFTLVGMRIWFGARRDRQQLSGGDTDALRQLIREIQEQIDGLREEHAELFERLDFAERVLTQGQNSAGEQPGGGPAD